MDKGHFPPTYHLFWYLPDDKRIYLSSFLVFDSYHFPWKQIPCDGHTTNPVPRKVRISILTSHKESEFHGKHWIYLEETVLLTKSFLSVFGVWLAPKDGTYIIFQLENQANQTTSNDNFHEIQSLVIFSSPFPHPKCSGIADEHVYLQKEGDQKQKK